MSNLNSNVCPTCPICTDILLKPRLYECGHTVCQKCMIEIDKTQEDDTNCVFDTVKYKCPLCRKISLYPWYKRSLNVYLIHILEKNQEYVKRIAEVGNDVNELEKNIDFPEDINISYIAEKSVEKKTKELYNYIIPLICDAALEGKSMLIITHRTKELQMVSDKLSEMLFNRGVYRVIARPSEFRVDILDREQKYVTEYVNTNFNPYSEYIDDIDENEDQTNREIDEEIVFNPPANYSIGENLLSPLQNISRNY